MNKSDQIKHLELNYSSTTYSPKMASVRSYKPSSYFTADGVPSKHHHHTRPHPKPSYPSSSSSVSASSDEDIIASLKGLALQSRTKEITSTSNSSSTNSSPRYGTPGMHGMLRFYFFMQVFFRFLSFTPPPMNLVLNRSL